MGYASFDSRYCELAVSYLQWPKSIGISICLNEVCTFTE